MRKRIKKLAVFLCTAAVVLSFAGCGGNEPIVATPTDAQTQTAVQNAATSANPDDTPVFMLEKLPEIGEYVDDIIYNRKYPEFRETLTPGEDYGKLIPFIGSFRDYHLVDYETGEWGDKTHSVHKYGLMTDKGEIVVDAVYDYVDITDIDNDSYVIALSKEGDEFETTVSKLICSSDGSWVKFGEEYANIYMYPVGDNIWVCCDRSDIDWENSTGAPKTYFCDNNGKKLFEFKNCEPADGSEFKDGYLALMFYDDYHNYEYKNRFIDKNGNLAFDSVYPVQNFENGNAVARNSKDKTGVFTVNGEWLIKPRFEYIEKNENYYIAKTDTSRWIFDMKGKMVKIISDNELGDMNIEVYGDRIFYSLSDYTQHRVRYQYFYADTGEPIKCKETGENVTEYIYGTEYFYYSNGEYTYIVNFDGNTVAKLKGNVGIINKIKDEYFEVIEGYWEDETQVYNIYSRDFEKLWSDQIKNTGDRIEIWANDEFVVKTYIGEENYSEEFYSPGCYDILEIETGKPIFKNISDYRTEEINGEVYCYVSDGTYTYTYAPDMTVLIKVRNENND